MKNWLRLLAFVLAIRVSHFAFAEENKETSTSGESKVELDQVKPNEEQNDNQITNARLAADAGSKSKVSLRAILSYSGGSIGKPFDRIRPNYRKLGSSPILDTTLGGSVGVAVRLDKESQLRFSTGVTMRTPLHNTLSEVTSNVNEQTRKRIFNVSGLSAEYNKTFRVGNVMYSPSIGASLATDQFVTEVVGLVGSASASLTAIFDIEGSGWQPGVSVAVAQYVYKNDDIFDGRGGRRDNLGLGVYPFVEYKFNDTYAFRTVLGFFNYTNYRDENLSKGQFTQDGHYISSGLGISVRRDIWVYPNIQFNPSDIRGDLTNVGVSTILNL
jgi:hypothetical protein